MLVMREKKQPTNPKRTDAKKGKSKAEDKAKSQVASRAARPHTASCGTLSPSEPLNRYMMVTRALPPALTNMATSDPAQR